MSQTTTLYNFTKLQCLNNHYKEKQQASYNTTIPAHHYQYQTEIRGK